MVASTTPRAAEGGERTYAAQRRAGAATAGAALGPDRQAVPIRDRRGERLAGRPLQRSLAAPHLPLHVRARLHGRLSVLFSDRRWLRRLRRAPGQPRLDSRGGLARADREAAGIQAQDGLELPVGIVVPERLQ